MKSDVWRGHAALVVVQFCFALFPIFGVLAFKPGGFGPLAVAGWRMGVGAAVLLAIAFAVHGRRAVPNWRDLPLLFVASLLGVTLNMVLYLEGLARSTPTNAALMMGLIPVFTFAIAAFAGQERASSTRVIGVLVALVGASSRFWAERPDLVREHAFGNLLMAANALCYSGYFVISRPILHRLPPLVVIAWVFALSVPFVPLFARGETFVPETATSNHWWALAFILVFPTVVAYVLNIYALSVLSASTTAVYIYMQPLITASASAWILQEELTPAMLISAVLVFAGIWLVVHPKRVVAPA
ncbi:MAG: DMT family transporter [Planctomycetota bacterium]|nr:DMT family transporter [Planctomycetota bacterium]